MRANLWDGYTINETLSSSVNVMRTTVHSSIKETPFERHFGRKPKTELRIYLNYSSNVKFNVNSAKPETLQVYTFLNSERHHDQLVMEAPPKLK